MSGWVDSLQSLSNNFDICILGEDGSGKSSLVYYYVHGRLPDDIDPSFENMYTKIIRFESSYAEVSIFDTSSSNDFLSSRKQQLANAESIMLTYAIDNRSSFELLHDIYERLESLLAEKVPISLVGLKCDHDSERLVPMEDALEFAQAIGAVSHCECSAVNAIGIDEAFLTLVDIAIRNRRKSRDCSSTSTNSDLGSRSTKSKIESTNESNNTDIFSTKSEPSMEGAETVHSHAKKLTPISSHDDIPSRSEILGSCQTAKLIIQQESDAARCKESSAIRPKKVRTADSQSNIETSNERNKCCVIT